MHINHVVSKSPPWTCKPKGNTALSPWWLSGGERHYVFNEYTLMKRLTADQKGSEALCFSHSAGLGWMSLMESAQQGGICFPHTRDFSAEELLFLWPLGNFSGSKPGSPFIFFIHVVIGQAINTEKLLAVRGHAGSGTAVSPFSRD